jgi:glycosyltransferase involved in cell wall biosynthesis
MNIVFVTAFYPPAVGGAEKKAARLARALAAHGHKITVITKRLDNTPERESCGGAEILRVGEPGAVRADLAAFAKILWQRRSGYDVIHNFLLSSLTNVCSLAAGFAGKPLLVSVGGTGVYGGIADRTGFGSFASLKWRHIARGGAHFVLPSRMSRHEFETAGIAPGRLHLLGNPVELEVFCPPAAGEKKILRDRLGLCGRTFVFVGRLEEQKGLDRLLSAWALGALAGTGAQLIIVGDGALRGKLAAQSRAPGLEGSVRFEGGRNNVPDYLRAADYFVLPSRGEGLSNAMLEAMACGLPPLTTDVSGSELIADGQNGFVVPNADDPGPLARALSRAALLPDEERGVLSAAARQFVERNNGIENITAGLEKIYLSLAAKC